MNKVKIIGNNTVIERIIPGSWQELTAGQVLFIAPRLLSHRWDVKRVKDEILAHLMNVKRYHLRRLNLSQMDGLHASINFLYEDIQLLRNPLPVVNVNNVIFVGPKEKLKDISFNQLMIADTYYQKYLKNDRVDDLDRMISALYYRRGKFIESHMDKNRELLSQMPHQNKLAILLFFIGSRAYMMGRFKTLFPKQADDPARESNNNENKFNWGDVLLSLVGENPADKVRIESLDAYFALAYLEDQIKKANKLKSKMKGR